MSKGVKIILVIAVAVLLCSALLLGAIMFDDVNPADSKDKDRTDNTEQNDIKVDEDKQNDVQDEEKNPDEIPEETPPETSAEPDTEPEPEIIHRYEVIRADVTWLEAKDACEKQGGHLVTFQDVEEYEKVIAMVENEGLKVFWAGARIYDIEDDWSNTKWITGEPFDFTQWYEPTNEPNKEESDEMYLMVFSVDGVWGYNDAPSDSNRYYEGKIGYVCEYEEYAE